MSQAFRQHLLFPDDWFSYWRLNCHLASYYEQVTKESGYHLENKWAFLQRAHELGVPCSPYLDMEAVCIKHRNEEGGMGIYFYKSATQGGDWIIQKILHNHPQVQALLPKGAPLSTFRVMTGSRMGIASSGETKHSRKSDQVFAFSCVFRAGRAGSSTDHNSVLFDVDVPNKRLSEGTSNMHWYQLGFSKIFTTPWLNHTKFTHHPDGAIEVTGQSLPEMDEMIETCVEAHRKLFPGVPIAGWDLAIVDGEPRMCLLEANLMCNFFKGSFDKERYFEFLEDYLIFTEAHEKA